MDYLQIRAFALATPRTGYQNQITGALRSLSDLYGQEFDGENSFLLPEGCRRPDDMSDTIAYGKFSGYAEFRDYIYRLLDAYLKKVIFPPRIFVTAYDMTESFPAAVNADMLCRAIKEFYKERNLGFVLTSVINGRIYAYKYVDLINVPKHLLTLRSRVRLLQNRELRHKILFMQGTINNFNRKTVSDKQQELLAKSSFLKGEAYKPFWEKFERFRAAEKKAVFCLGGRVDGAEIVFDVGYAKHLYNQAERLVLFQNCKPISVNDEECRKWRFYSGKYKEDFSLLQDIGNIYPAVLGFGNTIVVHTADSYSGCETAGAAIPTAISREGLYIDFKTRYDCLNLYKILCPVYAVDFDEFVDMVDKDDLAPDDLKLQVLPNSLRVFAETAVNMYNRLRILPEKR